MGLFSNVPNEEVAQLRSFWAIFLERWNGWYTAGDPHSAALNEDAIEPFIAAAKNVMADTFPAKPSAFKRLGTMAVLIQHFPIISLTNYKGEPLDKEKDCQWMPRLGLTATQIFASETSVVLPGGEKKLTWFPMPSPHFQLEFISVLRNYRLGAHNNEDLDPDLLCERALNASLTLEACYYLNEIRSQDSGKDKILGDVDGCLRDLDPVHRMDVEFIKLAAEAIAEDWGR